VRVRASLRLADHLAGGSRSADELARLAGADADAVQRLLAHLASRELVAMDGEGRWTLLPAGAPLVSSHPSGLRALLDVEGPLGRAELALVHLLQSVRNGGPSYHLQYGRPFWDDVSADPTRRAAYDARMAHDIGVDATAVAAAFDWGALGHVVDIGGGDGTLLATLLHAHPGLTGAVFDGPQTTAAARATLDAAGLGGRGTVVSGNFFDALPPGAGGYILSAVVHNWGDDAAARLLARCAEAAGDGRVFIIEKIGADGATIRTDMDLRVLAWMGGKERTVEELAGLARPAGLAVVSVRPAGPLTIVELHQRGGVPSET
jgi:hypothetical protein